MRIGCMVPLTSFHLSPYSIYVLKLTWKEFLIPSSWCCVFHSTSMTRPEAADHHILNTCITAKCLWKGVRSGAQCGCQACWKLWELMGGHARERRHHPELFFWGYFGQNASPTSCHSKFKFPFAILKKWKYVASIPIHWLHSPKVSTSPQSH